MKNIPSDLTRSHAVKFVIIFGIISFLADMTYEGARSITGPFLELLKANATTVGFVAGFGEMIGYVLRLASGYWVDKTHRYWLITFIGYGINLLAVPLLALAGSWEVAAFLIIMERFGKAIRVPARDTMLSHASHRMGMGWGFGLHEAFDRAGAMLGPIVIAIVLYYQYGYRFGFALLAIPAVLAIIALIICSRLYPHPQNLEIKVPHLETKGMDKTFWLYLLGAGFVAAGYADFPIIAYHFEKLHIMTAPMIPIFYAMAMGMGSITSLIFGRLFDRFGNFIFISAIFMAAFFAPFVFLGNEYIAAIGMLLWGLGLGSQTSLMKAMVGKMVATNKRGIAYGIFNTSFGIFWFLGSVTMGWLYDHSIIAVVIFSVGAQLIAIPVFWLLRKKM